MSPLLNTYAFNLHLLCPKRGLFPTTASLPSAPPHIHTLSFSASTHLLHRSPQRRFQRLCKHAPQVLPARSAPRDAAARGGGGGGYSSLPPVLQVCDLAEAWHARHRGLPRQQVRLRARGVHQRAALRGGALESGGSQAQRARSRRGQRPPLALRVPDCTRGQRPAIRCPRPTVRPWRR